MRKIGILGLFLAMFLATANACQIDSFSVESGVTQYYTAGFNIQYSNVTSADWGKDVDIFVLRSEDNIPIEEIYKDAKNGIKFSIPDNGNATNGFFYIGPKYVINKEYVLWVQACGDQKSATFKVVNQYGIGDMVGNVIIWFRDNIFYLVMISAVVCIISLFVYLAFIKK